METTFNGLGMSLGNLSLLSTAQTRSISAENFEGSKGKAGMAVDGTGSVPARELGRGWKVSPSIDIEAFGKVTLAEIRGPGVIQHIWLTIHPDKWRRFVLRMFFSRYYAFLLSSTGTARLVKKLGETKVLAEVEFRWEFEEPYDLRLAVFNSRITGWVNGKEMVSVEDDSEPLLDGGFAFVCDEGLITSDEIRVDPDIVV